jgi:hypothetical protein
MRFYSIRGRLYRSLCFSWAIRSVRPRAKRANSYLLVEQIPTWARQCGTIIGGLERLDDLKVKA